METALALREIAPIIVTGIMILGVAWLLVTRMKVKHGYPLGGGPFGPLVHPHSAQATDERVALLTQENAQLRAEISAVKDRLATVERIVTDGAYRLDREIEGLRGHAN
jgi:hypothetical protein